jgi:hypothetical protein
MNGWLESCAYRIDLMLWTFIPQSTCDFDCTCYDQLQTVVVNPVDTLRMESGVVLIY